MKTINFSNLQIRNFLSIGDEPVNVQFKTGINIITGTNQDKIDRQNGIGKTSIIDSVYFALYGEALRKVDKLEQLCNYRTKKSTEVRLKFNTLENNQTTVVEIIRELKPSKVHIFINGEDKTLDSISNNNALIVRLLQYDSEAFKNCIAMSLNNTDPFMLKKKQQKREFIESIFNLGIFSELLETTKKRYSALSKEQDLEAMRFDEIGRNIITYQNQKITAEKEKQTKITDLTAKINTANQSINTANGKLCDLQKIDFEGKYAELDTKSVKLKRGISEYRLKVDQNIKDIAESNTKISINNKKIKSIGVSTGTRADWEKSIAAIDKQITEKQVEIKNWETVDFNALRGDISKNKKTAQTSLEQWENTKQETQKQLQSNQAHLKINQNNLDVMSKQLGACPTCKRAFENHDKDAVEREKTALIDAINTINHSIEADTNTINTINTTIKDIKNSITQLDTDVAVIQNNEIKYQKLANEVAALIASKSPFEQSIKNEDEYLLLLTENNANNDIVTLNTAEKTKNEIAITQLESVLSCVETERKALDKQQQEITTYKNYIVNFENQIEQYKTNITDLNNYSDQFDKLISEAKVRQTTVQIKVDTFKAGLQLLDQAKFVFSEEGVKSYLIKKTLDLFNNRLAYYLKQLDSKYMCFFNEYFEEEILNDLGDTYSYHNLSGAERKMIDFACLFTFMDIRRLQGDVSVNVSFYDELLDTSLDTTGIEIVLNVLRERIEKYNESMFIISHRKESAKFATGEVVYLQMKNGLTNRIEFSLV